MGSTVNLQEHLRRLDMWKLKGMEFHLGKSQVLNISRNHKPLLNKPTLGSTETCHFGKVPSFDRPI